MTATTSRRRRLGEIQELLDRLGESTVPSVFVRDARWLIHTAQSALTRHMAPYFAIAGHVSASLTAADRLEIHKAGARLIGGHLRSQLHYRVWETHRTADDAQLLALARNSNSMDAALLVRDLVPVLLAYQTACGDGDAEARLELADAVLQGVSADPELFLTRLDLLGRCTILEELFVARGDEGRARRTSLGDAHLDLLDCYGGLIGPLAAPLKEDALALGPAGRVYSPYGITYGFCADILSNMALETLLIQPSFDGGLEEFFLSRGNQEATLARARLWESLPTRAGERAHFDHSPEWAAHMFARVTAGLDARVRHPARRNASNLRGGRLFVVPASDPTAPPPADPAGDGPALAQEYCFTSDVQRARSHAATVSPRSHISADRREGRFLASAQTDGRWFGVSKVILTLYTSVGNDALIVDVPSPVVEILGLTCPELTVLQPAPSGDAGRAEESEARRPGAAANS